MRAATTSSGAELRQLFEIIEHARGAWQPPSNRSFELSQGKTANHLFFEMRRLLVIVQLDAEMIHPEIDDQLEQLAFAVDRAQQPRRRHFIWFRMTLSIAFRAANVVGMMVLSSAE
jgi:hypothetical protein